jgi:hypothetical protein
MPVYFISDWSISPSNNNIYLRLARPFLDKPTLQHAVELEAAILVDRREGVELEVRIA